METGGCWEPCLSVSHFGALPDSQGTGMRGLSLGMGSGSSLRAGSLRALQGGEACSPRQLPSAVGGISKAQQWPCSCWQQFGCSDIPT